jgi:hypothetical protein
VSANDRAAHIRVVRRIAAIGANYWRQSRAAGRQSDHGKRLCEIARSYAYAAKIAAEPVRFGRAA